MDGRISIVLLVCVWCSLDAGGLLMVVTALPAASAVILTPAADRKEGRQVDMRCTATNLNMESHHNVEWVTIYPNVTLRRNSTTLTTNPRLMFTTTYPKKGEVVQGFTINDLLIDDYDRYVCNARQLLLSGESTLVATDSVILSPPSYPICSPSGPITVNTGTELLLRCLSKTDNLVGKTETHPMTDPRNYTWTSSSGDGMDKLSLNLTVTIADDGVVFNCSVLQGSGADTMTRPCIIGPISVMIEKTPALWVAFLVPVVTVVSIIVIMRRLIKRLTVPRASQIPSAAEHNIELQQPTEDNGTYLEPTATTTTQDTYHQPLVEVGNGSPEHDYARLEGSTNTSYEVARQPHSSAYRPYQNIDNNNKKIPLGVSPEYDYARPEGSTNTSYEAVRMPQSSAERPYQNIDNNNKKIPLGVVVRPEYGNARPEGITDRPYQNVIN